MLAEIRVSSNHTGTGRRHRHLETTADDAIHIQFHPSTSRLTPYSTFIEHLHSDGFDTTRNRKRFRDSKARGVNETALRLLFSVLSERFLGGAPDTSRILFPRIRPSMSQIRTHPARRESTAPGLGFWVSDSRFGVWVLRCEVGVVGFGD
jgi:hypothetical protein